jgi:CspA family cold shock protein
MNYRDRWETDENGGKFVFTVEMQRKLSQAGLPVEPASLAMLPDEQPQQSQESYNRGDRGRGSDNGGQRDGGRGDRFDRGDRFERSDRGDRFDRGGRAEAAEGPREVMFEEPESIQIDPETGKYIGRLKWYNPLRGYGFISRGGGADIFFHKTSTIGNPEDLDEGQWVLYDVEDRKKGPEATEVEPYNGEMAE